MTARPTDERDPLPVPEWQPASSAWARRAALQACREAVEKARETRKKAVGEVGGDE